MNQYLDKVANNIFPLSLEKSSLNKALKEWEYSGVNIDAGYAEETCQLCNHESIRFQFEILNKHNGNALLIGSQCINKYDSINVIDNDGRRLDHSERKMRVNHDRRKLITDARVNNVLRALILLGRIKGEKLNFEDIFSKYKEDKKFTPRQAWTVLWRLKVNHIAFKSSDIQVSLRGKWKKQATDELSPEQILDIWDCLETKQKNTISGTRNDLPPSLSKKAFLCPACSSPMKIRNGTKGKFWGCTRYPTCKRTRNI